MEKIYSERLTSTGTTMLFTALAALFLGWGGWRSSLVGFRTIPVILLVVGLFFVVYVINYRVLVIALSSQELVLRFGLVSWKMPLANIAEIRQDDSPPWIKYGGAGVHFAFVRGQYRAFFNFLEHPRLLVAFRTRRGPVQALVFSTRNPDQIRELIAKNQALL
jgi:hypothetical protein